MTERREEARKIVSEMFSPEMAAALSGGPMKGIFAGEIAELAFTHAYVDLWARPGLERKIRSIVTISMMIALLNRDELEIHIPAAVRNGLSIAELEEIIYHASGYVGFPAAASVRTIAIDCLAKAGLLSAGQSGNPA